ncbi:transformer 2 beta [Mitosporidium daphniae]
MAESRQNESTSTGPISNVLGIFGLSMYTTEKTLQDIYEPYGNVESFKLIYDGNSRRSRAFGFVTFVNEASAEKALASTNGVQQDTQEPFDGHSITYQVAFYP